MQEEKLLTRKEVQVLLIDMLQKFADYCERHGLRYHLVGGTLLGAVRHKGFIPWDDDIDVGMPRSDYEKFLELVKTEPVDENYQVISLQEGNSPLPFAQLIHNRTRVERPSEQFMEEEFIVLKAFLDIFPQDGWPEEEAAARRVVNEAKFLRTLNRVSKARIGRGATLARKLAKIPVAMIAKMFGPVRINRWLDAYAKRYDYDTSKYVGAITYGVYGIGERCLREEVVQFVDVEFEGKMFKAPGCWDSYLSGIYGDYMTLPPEEKRINHGLKVWLLKE